MANLFEGAADARQSPERSYKVSRFRPTYRALSDNEKAIHDAIKAKAVELEEQIETMEFPPGAGGGRYKALALTALEEAIMWAVKALTS